ncbi:hypothetical protein Misp01_60650 [Microtetraspora sp. NBRC 13810]|uniref:Bug family tripartite tricarboxylate transporter substrate binding protein n=1 Tax=Microtetraspora sp. NBRC 13810 TaxID=3030990 RepID=UPI0024A144A8|nr:tripartite tricarboxylate transporter substrate-binding protein [Microtetraspora sp. NBRC 13810]GLW10937.1 hypothetical protein Misp01_60650 [Microtetraspora sp. NBRC 13810]
MYRRGFLALGAGLVAAAAGCSTRGPTAERSLTGLSVVAATAARPEWREVAAVLVAALGAAGLARAPRADSRSDAPVTVVRDVLGGRPAAGSAGWLLAGVPLVASVEMDDAGRALESATPLARLIGDREVLVVPHASRLRDFEAFAAALRRAPDSLHVAGGPAGGAEHVLFGLIAQGLGVDARRVEYAGYSTAGLAASAVLAGRVPVAIGRLGEWRRLLSSGAARALAVSSAARIDGVDAPSLLECGVGVDFADWCGLLGPAGMTDDERVAAAGVCDRLGEASGWRDACRAHGWPPLHLGGDGFAQWFGAEIARTRAVLRDLGLLAHPDTTYGG